ncbi:hypothetical protein HZU77_015030 [Neisseriaceae bacterium TC5R-5]|nr:hypothetical protein [Neisseriaceae bacterium TC5R-5]
MARPDLLYQALSRLHAPSPPLLDSSRDTPSHVLASADSHTAKEIALEAVASIQQWAETDDLSAGESSTDRLFALLVGIADANKDGEISDDEQEVLDIASEAAWDYLLQCGAADEDIDLLFNGEDADKVDDVAERLRELVLSMLPEGEEAASAEIDQFVFGETDQEAVFDAVYKMRVAVRGGKKMRIRKRVSGTVRLSAAQKIAIRKARMKSHSAGARMRRMRSMKVRRKSNL